jgi:hypothetical protein
MGRDSNNELVPKDTVNDRWRQRRLGQMNTIGSRRDCDIGPVIYQDDCARIIQYSDNFLREFVQQFYGKGLLPYLDKVHAVVDRIPNSIQNRIFLIFEICRICFARGD